jgi:hypothetical protein
VQRGRRGVEAEPGVRAGGEVKDGTGDAASGEGEAASAKRREEAEGRAPSLSGPKKATLPSNPVPAREGQAG